MELYEAAWGWYKQQYPRHLLHAHRSLRALFGSAAGEPMEKLERILEKPSEYTRLGTEMHRFIPQLEVADGSIPMQGLSVSELLTPLQAKLQLPLRKGQEASLRYRSAIVRSLTTPELHARYPVLESTLLELLRAMMVFMREALKDRLPPKILGLVLANERLYLLCYFWFVCNHRYHPVLAGIEYIRMQGGFVLWFNRAGHATLLIDEMPTDTSDGEPFTLDLDNIDEDGPT